MGVKAVTKYESEDGKLHATVEVARAHNSLFKNMNSMRKFFSINNPTTVHTDLVNDPVKATELRDNLNKVLAHHRLYGKLKK